MILVKTVLTPPTLVPARGLRADQRLDHRVDRMGRTIATTTTVDRAGLLEFARTRHRMILLTTRADGGIQGSPVTAGVDTAGRVVIATIRSGPRP